MTGAIDKTGATEITRYNTVLYNYIYPSVDNRPNNNNDNLLLIKN